MLERFVKNIKENFPFIENKKFYIAVSGGIDSMVLLHLFQHFPFSFGVLHCNFKLRGDESDADMRFIHDYCEANTIQLRIGFFETQQIAKELKMSIQETARNLRYNWFYEQMEENKVDFVATAHHLDDNVETFLINFTRGTGLEGFTGIPLINDKIFRPLLPFSREEIENYAKSNNIQWREDSSNASNKYLRNKLRHDVIPILKEINPNFLTSFQKTQMYLQQAQSMVEDAANIVYQEVATEFENEIHFDINLLVKLPNYQAYLYQWLHHYGFTAWDDIYNLVASQSGKQVLSNDFRILKNRNSLIVKPIGIIDENKVFYVEQNQEVVNIPLKLKFCKANQWTNTENTIIFADENKLKYPLTIRKWKQGDVFQPFGMNGKSKKVSKFFKDEKLSLFEKENTWFLCSDNQIVWIIGIRQDERFKVDASTKNIVQITLI